MTKPSWCGLRLAGVVDDLRQPADDVTDALAGDRRHAQPVPVVHCHVDLRADHDAGALEQGRLVRAELVQQDLLLALGCLAIERREVDEHAQGSGPLDVAEELVAEPLALGGAFDEPGDVGDHELGAVVEADDAEVRFERGERVVGHLGLGRRDAADEGALAGVREPDESDVGHELELELEPPFHAVLALLGERRRPAVVGEEPGVAPATPTTG